ncbi:DUF3226 domain-containing protein [Pseudomonas sp. RC10]|uniref:DUF3226 domain-containing protein n=1 Tax=Pseudomonas bambusae TaxID=3139142 RepID=UPI0031386894
MMEFKHKGPKVLLVEGKNDAHLVCALCVYFNLPESFGIYNCESDNHVLRRLNVLLIGSEPLEVVGVILDADAPSLISKWRSVSTLLTEAGYEVPANPSKNGTIITKPGRPTIGVWLMPDNEVDGMLEDFCLKLAPQAAVEYAAKCVAEAQQNGLATFSATHSSKAAVHTYLAWQDEPGMPLGLAVKAKALDPRQPIAADFSDFLMRLF